jgi:hypothetical protein
MPRTTAAKVIEIMETDLTEVQVGPYVTSANIMVTSALGDSGLGTDLLAEIERWVAAHAIASSRERQAVDEKAGPAAVKYAGQYGANLASTSYGQMAMVLDTTGTLAGLGGRTASIRAVESFV